MSLSVQLRQLRLAEAAAEAAQAKLKALQEAPELKQVKEFETDLRGLLARYNMSLVDVNIIMDPKYKAPKQAVAAPGKRPVFKGREYKNPHTGETTIHARGTNKVLDEWRAKWGRDTVDSWGTLIQ